MEDIGAFDGKPAWSKQGPNAVNIKWVEGASDESQLAAQEFVKELVKDVNEPGMLELPEAVESITIYRS